MNNTTLRIAVLTINRPSLDAAKRLRNVLAEHRCDIYTKEGLAKENRDTYGYEKLDDVLPHIWASYDALIALIAVGALIRKIAPLLRDKTSDPAVVALNLELTRVIPLLGGHLGGANTLAQTLADRLPSCINFVTTATDQTGTPAFDTLAKARKWRIVNLSRLATLSNAMINGEPVYVHTSETLFKSLPTHPTLRLASPSHPLTPERSVVISPHIHSQALTLVPKIALGIGCNRGIDAQAVLEAIEAFLFKRQLRIEDIETIASFDAKRDENGLLEAARKLNKPLRFFSKEEINALTSDFSPSASTRFFGLKGVAEPSAVLASRYRTLSFEKDVYFSSITIAGAY